MSMIDAYHLKSLQGGTGMRVMEPRDVHYVECYGYSGGPSRPSPAMLDENADGVVAAVMETLQRPAVRVSSADLREAEGHSV